MRTKREALRRAKVLLGRIEAAQANLRLLKRLKLSPKERREVSKLEKEARELKHSAKFHIKVIKGGR